MADIIAIGTSHFISFAKAKAYYESQEYDEKSIMQKLEEGDFHIGPPPQKDLQPGDVLEVNSEGRFIILKRKSG